MNVRNIEKELGILYDNFDVDDHVAMWLKAKSNGVSDVPCVTTLIDDAREIEKCFMIYGKFTKEFCIS